MAGAAVYAELLETMSACLGFRYSPLGLRDGLLAQMAAEYDRSTRSGKQIESERWDSLRAAVAHYQVDMHHAMQVRESAMYLFKALEPVHRLPPEYREWLSAAAMLYEVGRLREPQWQAPAHALHHFALRDSGLHAGAAPDHRGHCALSGQIAPHRQ